MRAPERIELSFLIEALHLNPDEFFEDLYQGREYRTFRSTTIGSDEFIDRLIEPGESDRKMGFDSLLGDTIQRVTRNNVGNMDLHLFNDDTVDAWEKYIRESEWKNVSDDRVSIFEFIRKIGEECLLIQNGKIYFKIDKFKTWQHVSFHCGEDLFVAAMLADENINSGYNHKDFQWDYILKSDFFRLNSLIDREKINENHFHLAGSAPMVDLSWIYLMNHPLGQEDKYKKFWERKESYYQSPTSHRPSRQSDMETLVKIAAWIRLYLFEKIVLKRKTKNTTDKGNDNNNLDESIKGEAKGTDSNNFNRSILDIDLYRIYLMLNGNAELAIKTDDIESTISCHLYDSPFSAFDSKVDYAIINDTNVEIDKNCSYIAGERFFTYRCVKYVFENPKDSFIQTLYYFYLLIKHYFNRLFIQSNNKTGFHNFKEYTDRKGDLMDTKYYRMAINMAVQGNFNENCLEQLEVRTAPKAGVVELREIINTNDSSSYLRSPRITRFERLFPNGTRGIEPRKYGDGTDKHFYVLHFIKQRKPEWFEKKDYDNTPLCREYKNRDKYKQEAQTLMQLMESGDEICSRIFGIDAASNEVHFRPENFGPAFRYLSSYKIRQDVPWEREIPDLRKTYHVGEDFFDVLDGLRAIYEAVLFLELSHGDRIGHGVALGIDVGKWYQTHGKITLPRQNKLDNIAWMLYMIRHWGIETTTAYYQELMTEFEKLYLELYEEESPGIKAYMEAWQMRGDDPECYFSHDPEEKNTYATTRWERSRIRDKELYMEHAKKRDKVYKIYHRYHFDTALKRRALESVTQEYKQQFKGEYVKLVKQLQIRMRSRIAERGIAVESCPSSNFLISNLDEFKEIPTFQLFPIHEDTAEGLIRLNVCVNTDDQGVFYTSLMKEYTMLAAIMREEKENGVRKYSDDAILSWIKHLIDNSKQLCFRTGDVRYYGIRSNTPFSKTSIKTINSQLVLPYISMN